MPSYPVLELEGGPAELELALSRLMDFPLLGADEGLDGSRLRAFFPEGTELEPIAREVERAIPGIRCRAAEPAPARDWLAEWKKSFTGFALGESFFVSPTWTAPPELDRRILLLDPEQAFGTGTHDTTRLCAQLLERWVRPGDRVIDLGAGTAILSMVGARSGAASVRALEPDEDAARCAIDNVARNGLQDVVRIEIAGYQDFEALEADLIVANINRPVLEAAVQRMEAKTLVLSGILLEEVDELLPLVPGRFRPREVWSAGEWAALVLG